MIWPPPSPFVTVKYKPYIIHRPWITTHVAGRHKKTSEMHYLSIAGYLTTTPIPAQNPLIPPPNERVTTVPAPFNHAYNSSSSSAWSHISSSSISYVLSPQR